MNNTDFKGTRVLLLEGYARQCLPLIRAFKKLGCHVSALCRSRLDVAHASRLVDRKILGICDRERPTETAAEIEALLKSGNFDLVVPTVDFSARLLAEHKADWSQYARLAICDYDTYMLAQDKLLTMEICQQNGIPCPRTAPVCHAPEDVLTADLGFPLVAKPRISYGAIGFHRIDSEDALRALFATEGFTPDAYLFQEYIAQDNCQYECALFMDGEATAKTAAVFSKNRWFPLHGGSSTFNITVQNAIVADSCTRLLASMGWQGAADIDLIHDPADGQIKIMEVNPRVSGSVKICFLAGIDQARQMLELSKGLPVTHFTDYKKGVRLRCTQTDLLWFLKSPQRFRSRPSWFSPFGTHDHTFYLDDPLPFFAFSLQGIKKFKSEIKKRS